jgi:predicted glycoside hydrolase/deacetylase ChbG (UPF0249 family)
LANGPRLEEQLGLLRSYPRLDVGVHLNLTYGKPITRNMGGHLKKGGGCFTGKFTMAGKVISGRLPIEDVEAEWTAQIDRCLAFGLQLRFLNSHEHIHMLPSLFPIASRLARNYGIDHVRFPTAANISSNSLGGVFRNVVMGVLGQLTRSQVFTPAPHFWGLDVSGKLSMRFLRTSVRSLERGCVYELMCHPGQFDPDEIRDPRLRSYHDWEGELNILTSPKTLELFRELDIRLIGYRDLVVTTQGLTVAM